MAFEGVMILYFKFKGDEEEVEKRGGETKSRERKTKNAVFEFRRKSSETWYFPFEICLGGWLICYD